MIDVESITNQIINADCMDILKQLPDKCIDAIICDLPYGTTACSWDSIIPFDKLWEQYKRIRKDNTPIVLFGSEPFSTYLRMSNIQEFRYDWVWNKFKGGNPLLAKKQPIKITENISIFGNNIKYYPLMVDRDIPKKRGSNKGRVSEINNNAFVENKTYYQYYPKNLLNFSNANQNDKIHPTQKPVALLEYLIKTYSNEGDLILDNCSGSGTTAIASHNLKRRFICIERDTDYYNASVERLKIAQSQLKLF